MDWKIYEIWTEEFKGYYWEFEGNGVCVYIWDDYQENVEDLLSYSQLEDLEQANKKAKENGGYPTRIVAERFKPVELTEEDLNALKQEILDDDDDDLFKELDENYRVENHDDFYYVDGELYVYDEEIGKLCHCESEGMLTPVGYDPNDDDDDE